MKVMTVMGTRPEIIRLSRVIPLMDRHCEHVLVHTGQNYDKTLKDVFFKQLRVREPDHVLEVKSTSVMGQIGSILTGCETLMREERPDRLLVLGDTNSGLSAYVAKRMGIKVYHMEAGNRCHDDRVPEEVNRRVIDTCSDMLMPYTERSMKNLVAEGIPHSRIHVTGNPILEVLTHHTEDIASSDVMERMEVEPGKFMLATLHREENVDVDTRLRKFVKAFSRLTKEHSMPIIWSVHPRTRKRLTKLGLSPGPGVRMIAPLGLFDFIRLEKNAACVLTDSGTVQEECCIFKVPNVTLRDVTERPETVEVGSNILSGAEPDSIARCVDLAMSRPTNWNPPWEYLVKDVSSTVTKIVLSHK